MNRDRNKGEFEWLCFWWEAEIGVGPSVRKWDTVIYTLTLCGVPRVLPRRQPNMESGYTGRRGFRALTWFISSAPNEDQRIRSDLIPI